MARRALLLGALTAAILVPTVGDGEDAAVSRCVHEAEAHHRRAEFNREWRAIMERLQSPCGDGYEILNYPENWDEIAGK